ncbi:MAG: bifunctional oligoribonuclease/PAP phosphatase NrnA [Thermodesulfobacteriota bacterium]|nr:bifunctional oligoribonuclease/PAP phosphatase NrnA [Thermodesulfobacteriota bacterium]
MKEKVANIIRNHEKFEIITHENPDADAVGASRGLAYALDAMGKKVELVYPSPAPRELLFEPLPRAGNAFTPQITMMVDVSDMGMIGTKIPRGELVVIDHHRNFDKTGICFWVDPEKSSASEMVYDLLTGLGVEVDERIASNLYMGIFGDTGGFIHSNTTPRVFEIVRDLAFAGANPNAIAYRLKRSRPMAYFRILCVAMERIIERQGVCGSYITLKDMRNSGAKREDTSGIIDQVASLDASRLSIFMRDIDRQKVHCSIRSRTNASALKTARAFGGGGHERAAGFTMKARSQDLIEAVIEEGCKWVNME